MIAAAGSEFKPSGSGPPGGSETSPPQDQALPENTASGVLRQSLAFDHDAEPPELLATQTHPVLRFYTALRGEVP